MDKEKEMQEMAKVLCGDKSKHLSSCKYCGETSCYFIANAELLYNAGYRKADEVRKETAKEIFTDLWRIFKTDSCARTIKEYAEMYGVEINE